MLDSAKNKLHTKYMNIEDFLKLPPNEKVKYETERIGCDGAKMISLKGHSLGTLHTICPVCKCCHDCDDGE